MSSNISGMRSPMLKGPRREAKTIVTDFVIGAIGKIENVDQVPDCIRDQLITQLKAMQYVAQKMNWKELEGRIKRALAVSAPKNFEVQPMSQEQINAHSYAQANECTPADYFKSMGKPVPAWAT